MPTYIKYLVITQGNYNLKSPLTKYTKLILRLSYSAWMQIRSRFRDSHLPSLSLSVYRIFCCKLSSQQNFFITLQRYCFFKASCSFRFNVLWTPPETRSSFFQLLCLVLFFLGHLWSILHFLCYWLVISDYRLYAFPISIKIFNIKRVHGNEIFSYIRARSWSY